MSKITTMYRFLYRFLKMRRFCREKEKARKPYCLQAFPLELLSRFELPTSSLPIIDRNYFSKLYIILSAFIRLYTKPVNPLPERF